MIKFIKTKARFYSEDSDLMGKDEFEEDDFCFNLDEVSAFNRSKTDGYTTIRLKSGFDISVDITFERMIGLLEGEHIYKIVEV